MKPIDKVKRAKNLMELEIMLNSLSEEEADTLDYSQVPTFESERPANDMISDHAVSYDDNGVIYRDDAGFKILIRPKQTYDKP